MGGCSVALLRVDETGKANAVLANAESGQAISQLDSDGCGESAKQKARCDKSTVRG